MSNSWNRVDESSSCNEIASNSSISSSPSVVSRGLIRRAKSRGLTSEARLVGRFLANKSTTNADSAAAEPTFSRPYARSELRAMPGFPSRLASTWAKRSLETSSSASFLEESLPRRCNSSRIDFRSPSSCRRVGEAFASIPGRSIWVCMSSGS